MIIDNAPTQLSTPAECSDFAWKANEFDGVSRVSLSSANTSKLDHGRALEFIFSNKAYIAETISGVVGRISGNFGASK